MPNQAPIVTVSTKTVFLNTAIPASSLFSVSDPDGDPILKYRFYDFSNVSTTGYFELNGAPKQNGSTIEITAAQLANLVYVGGSQISNERIRVQAWDGSAWSDAEVNFRMYTTRNQITRPNILVSNQDVLANESIGADTFISAYDPDGYPITKYYLRDDLVNNSYFMLGNTQMPQGTFFTVTADQLANLRYYGYGQGSETIRAFAYDGSTWSVVGIGTLTTRPNLNRPTVNFTQLQVPTRELSPISNALTFQDADGNSIKRVRIWDTSAHSFSGYLVKNGETLAAKQWNEMTLNEFNDLQYVGADRQMNEVFAVRVYDGRYWSPVERIVFKTVFRPEIGTERQVFKTQLVSTDVKDLFDKIDTGPAYEQYQIVDMSINVSSGTDISGYLTQGSGKLSPFTVYDMTASEFNATQFISGPYEVAQTDEIYARAYNGVYWSEWTRIEINTHPEFDRALVNPIGLNNLLEWNDFSFVLPAPSVVSYSFMQAFPSYDSGDASEDTFTRFTNDMCAGARRAFGLIEQYANVAGERPSNRPVYDMFVYIVESVLPGKAGPSSNECLKPIACPSSCMKIK